MEQLETRNLLTTVTELENVSIKGNVGEKPESKLWEHEDTWYGIFTTSDEGNQVWRLDGDEWTPIFALPSSTPYPAKADVKVVGDVVHALLEDDDESQLVSLKYVPGSPGGYELWDERPTPADVELAFSVEAATIDIDSTGRMWVAYDNNGNRIQVRYADAPYADWSADPITLADDVHQDDLSSIVALPNGTIGVLWSDQNADLFGFRTHVDGADPLIWSADEQPASQSALDVGRGMADDHINVAVGPDSTLYAAVKTSYDTPGLAKVGLLVRRPNGIWDDLHYIDDDGTRPGVWLNTATDSLIITYDNDDFVYRECPTSTLVCSPFQTFVSRGTNQSSTKQAVTDEIVIVTSGADTSTTMRGAIIEFDQLNNVAPTVNAGIDATIFDVQAATLDGSVSDDGLPNPPGAVTTTWSVDSGPGTVTFADASAIDTTATFSATGVYQLRLTADDSLLSGSDVVQITVNETPPNQPPTSDAGADQNVFLSQTLSLDGTANDDGLPIPPGAMTTLWSMVSGPGAVTFGDATAIDTTAAFSAVGEYVLRLEASDGEFTTPDDLTVSVLVDPPNFAPSVDAGNDQTIVLSSSANLNGQVTDDGRPNPPASVTIQWTKVSGPGTATFVNASIPDTAVSFDQTGTYVLRLTGDDSELTGTDEITINVIQDPPTQSISFQDGVFPSTSYDGTRDIKMRSDNPDTNYGTSERLELDGNPDFSSAVKWDLSSIPAGANVVSATITVNVIRESFASFQIYEALRAWDEDTATFLLAGTGVPWETPGAQGPSDRGSMVLGEITAPNLGPVTVELNGVGRAVVQNWIENPASNLGLLWQDYDDASTDDLDFNSREAGTATERPKLEIVYAIPPETSLVIDDVTVNEDAGSASFTVSLTAASGVDVDFSFATTDVSATAGTDYTSTSGSGTIAAGATSTTVTVDITDDTLDELDETFQVNITNVVNATIQDGTGIATITDNDVNLSIDDVTVDENAGIASFTVSLSSASTSNVDFSFATSDITATAGSDYTGLSGTRTIPAGATSTNVDISITDDAVAEVDETFEVTLTSPVNATISDAIGVGTIADNEVSISIDDVTVAESATTATFTVTLNKASTQPIDFTYTTADVSTTAGSDYTAVSATQTINAGQTSTTVTVDILEDGLDESDEVFEVGLSNVVNAVILDGTGQGTITDNDASPSLSIDDVTVDEGAGQAVFTVSLSEVSGLAVDFNFATTDISAAAGSDYTAATSSGSIPSGSSATTISVDITEDTVAEFDETFEVALSSPTNATLLDATGVGTIQDNELSLSIDDVTVDEGAGEAVFTVTLSASTTSAVEFAFDTADVSATAGSDYTAASGTGTIGPGATSTTVTVPITEDVAGEGDETFQVALSAPTNAQILDGTGIGTIQDNDATLSIDDVTVDESAGTATFTVSLNTAIGSTVEFNYATADVSALAASDYTAGSGTGTIPPGGTSTTVSVGISEDTLDEADETFNVNLSDPVGATILDGTGVGTITDNDDLPSLSIDDVSVDEGAGTATFTISLSAASSLAVEFAFSTADGTAAAGSDFTAASGTGTITPGLTATTVIVSISEDADGEGDETFDVNLASPVNATILDGTGTATILDNDLSLSIDDVTVDEDAGTATFTVSQSQVSGSDVGFSYATADGTAVGGADYTAAASSGTIFAGSLSATVVIDIADDTLDEFDETFQVDISNPSSGSILKATGVGTIVDNDVSTTTDAFQDGVFPTPAYNGTRDIKMRFDNANTNYGSTSRLELDGNPDFSSVVKWDVSSIAPGTEVVSARVTVNVIRESFATFELYEGLRPWNESTATFTHADTGVPWETAGAQGPSDRGTEVLGQITAPTLGLVTVELNEAGRAAVQRWVDNPAGNFGIFWQDYDDGSTDDLDFHSRETGTAADRPKLEIVYAVPPDTSLAINDVTVSEDAGAAIFTVSLNAPSAVDVDFTFATADVSATAGNDYTSISGSGTIVSGATSTTISVDITEDTLDELAETFQVNITNVANATILDGTGVGTIIDNDANLSIDDVTVDEDAGVASFTVSLSSANTADVDFSFATSDVTATAGLDYTALSGTQTIPAGATSTTVDISILDDAIAELDETFEVALSNPVNATISDAIGVGTIADDEISLSIDDVTADENAGTATFTVSLNRTSSLPVDFSYTTSDVSAAAGSDYTAASGTQTIAAGATSITVSVDILEDALDELDEVFEVGLSNAVNAFILDGTGQGTITDNDPLPGLSIDDVNVDESVGQAVFTVSLSEVSGLVVDFSFATADGTATAGSDYSAGSGSGSIPAGSSTTTISVDISDDTVAEFDETFNVTLSSPANATLLDATGVGTILDNEVTLSIDDVTVDETAAEAVFTVSLSGVSGLSVGFAFDTSDGTAAAGSDYTAASGTGTIDPGSTSTTVTVPILDDAVGEGDETFNVTLSSPTNALLLDETGVGTIQDNDATISIDDVTVDEGVGSATFTVNLNAASAVDVEFSFATSDASAVVGADYALGSGTGTITAGATSTTVSVNIIDDLLDENDETFEVNLSNAVNATISDGLGVATITDNDDLPSLSIDDVAVDEGAGTATFTISLNTISSLAVDFSYSTADGSAAAGIDYSATSGTGTILAGAISTTVTVSILENSVGEADETFDVNLSSPVNATILDGTGTGTILDNDLSLSVDDVTVDEDAGTATFTVRLSQVTTSAVDFTYATADLTATAGEDYSAGSGSASILAGFASTTVSVPLTDDAVDEPDETFQLIISNATSGVIVDDTGIATIADNDFNSITISFQDELLPTTAYSGTRDAKVRGDMPSSNFGSSGRSEIDGNPDIATLTKWDISQIPSNSTVHSVSITVHVTNSSNHEFNIYQVLRPWIESQATFDHADFNTLWEVAGVQGATDRGSTVLGTLTAPTLGDLTIDLNSAGVSTVQSWVDGSAPNNGFVFQDFSNASTDDLDFASRDRRSAPTHPKLTIEYSEPPVLPRPVGKAAAHDSTPNSLDVSGDGVVAPNDALLVINHLNEAQVASSASGEAEAGDAANPRLDVSNDGFVAPNDALLVINHLNGQQAAGAEGEGGTPLSIGATSARGSAAPLGTTSFTGLSSWPENSPGATSEGRDRQPDQGGQLPQAPRGPDLPVERHASAREYADLFARLNDQEPLSGDLELGVLEVDSSAGADGKLDPRSDIFAQWPGRG